MKKVLGLVISSRKLGNSEILVKEIMDSIPQDCQRELIRLTDLRIEPCRACYRCMQPEKECLINDDFNYVISKITQADAVIIGVPIYFLGPHGYYKMLSDRLLSAYKLAEFTAGKPLIMVTPYGIKGWEGYTRAAALVIPRFLQMKIIDLWQVEATLPGDCLINPSNLEYARSLGVRLFDSPAYTPEIRECPYCGSDLFRLHPNNKIECPICKAEATLQEDNIPSWSNTNSNRFSSANIQEHFGIWLIKMKEKYYQEKEKLKELQKPYRDKDWWVKP
ncbi:MAG: flavodoxin family protein [Syntrophomonadaceae bacterium]|jgi:multimeric flavodoxin WrbA